MKDIHPRDYHKINSDIRIISHYAGSRAEKEEDIKGLIEEFCVERNRPVYLLNAESVPHVCGDEPIQSFFLMVKNLCSPRVWG